MLGRLAGLALEAENTGQPLPVPFALSVEPTAGEAALPESPTEIAPALWATLLVAALLAPLPTPVHHRRCWPLRRPRRFHRCRWRRCWRYHRPPRPSLRLRCRRLQRRCRYCLRAATAAAAGSATAASTDAADGGTDGAHHASDGATDSAYGGTRRTGGSAYGCARSPADTTYRSAYRAGDTADSGADRTGHAANLRTNIPPAQKGE